MCSQARLKSSPSTYTKITSHLGEFSGKITWSKQHSHSFVMLTALRFSHYDVCCLLSVDSGAERPPITFLLHLCESKWRWIHPAESVYPQTPMILRKSTGWFVSNPHQIGQAISLSLTVLLQVKIASYLSWSLVSSVSAFTCVRDVAMETCYLFWLWQKVAQLQQVVQLDSKPSWNGDVWLCQSWKK